MLYRFPWMPSSLKNLPSTLQRAKYFTLSTAQLQFALFYLDDIIIFFTSLKEPLDHIQTVLDLSSEASMLLKLKNCFSSEKPFEHLRHIIQLGILTISNESDAIQRLQRSANATEFIQTLCFRNLFTQFVRSFAPRAALLNCKLKIPAFSPSMAEQYEVPGAENAAKSLVAQPTLPLPRPNVRYRLHTNTVHSNSGVSHYTSVSTDEQNP